MPLPTGCTPADQPLPSTDGDLTCTYKQGGDRCNGLEECWWVGARKPGATGTITCTSGTCETKVQVVQGADAPEGSRGEWARLARKGEPAGFHLCDTPFPGTPLRPGLGSP